MGDNIGEIMYTGITLQHGFTYNAVAPPGRQTQCYIEGAVYFKCECMQKCGTPCSFINVKLDW